jgi:hypothetical protein
MWTYEQKTGNLLKGDSIIATGYAGYGPGKNNPEFECVKNTGPLPRGQYTINAPYNSKKVGNYALILTPDIHNNMFGRDDFRIHGDSIASPGTASQGCIILPLAIRQLIWRSGDRGLEVT